MSSRMMERIPGLAAALPALAMAIAFAGCAPSQGKLINLDDGEEIRLSVKQTWNGYEVEGILEDGRRLKGDMREVIRTAAEKAGPPWKRGQGAAPVDTVYYGSGYLKDGSRVIDFEYHRAKGETGAVGTATDNRGRRYKLLL